LVDDGATHGVTVGSTCVDSETTNETVDRVFFFGRIMVFFPDEDDGAHDEDDAITTNE